MVPHTRCPSVKVSFQTLSLTRVEPPRSGRDTSVLGRTLTRRMPESLSLASPSREWIALLAAFQLAPHLTCCRCMPATSSRPPPPDCIAPSNRCRRSPIAARSPCPRLRAACRLRAVPTLGSVRPNFLNHIAYVTQMSHILTQRAYLHTYFVSTFITSQRYVTQNKQIR